ncbi:hypothetical protein DFQ05_1554 [Winogradskyella wandonensis]|uniref:Uncharacterized protein n=1 Tax=Winogradskyella wandonensis TaxID=1442586 RepID=A0A4R1KT92_9FLAO|nr:hypothetical protein DFQ05_1554 [Winogradskyella wandonensis]
MIKSLLIYVVSFAALFFVVLHLQHWLLEANNQSVRFSYYDTNIFFAVASALICIHLQLFSSIKSLQPQLGYIYLPTLFIKGGLFFFSFQDAVFALENLTVSERLCLLSSLLIFLLLEVFFVIKILKQNTPKILS